MFNAYGMARLGRDAEIRSTTDGQQVASLSLAFTVFVKREKVTQWVDAALWGARAESLAPYLLKGARVVVALENLHEEKFTKADGTPMSKLVARVSDIDLAGDAAPAQAPAPEPRPAARPAPARTSAPARTGAAAPAAHGFDDMDDDIPFILNLTEFSLASPKERRMSRCDFK